MDTFSLQRLILRLELLPAEKLVGMALALRLDRKSGKVRVQQKTLAEECGFSVSTAKRAIKRLVDLGVFESKRTGRATILTPRHSGKKSGIVEVPPTDHLIAHPRSIREKKRLPWDYDIALSSLPEEKRKREDRQFALEKAGKSG